MQHAEEEGMRRDGEHARKKAQRIVIADTAYFHGVLRDTGKVRPLSLLLCGSLGGSAVQVWEVECTARAIEGMNETRGRR